MKNKRLVSLIMSVILVATLVIGCSNPTDTQPETTPEPAPAETATPTPDEGSERAMVGNMYIADFPILEEKATYTIAVNKDSNSMNSFNEKQCVLDTEELTNVHIDWMDIPSSGWNEQVNIMLASENLPDAFSGGKIDTMKNIELFVPIKDIVNEYAPNIKEMLDTDPAILKAITAPDGEIYGLPTNKDNPSDSVGGLLWINGEWLDAVGKPMPTTTDEFTEVMSAFKTQDPNKNGIADEIPLLAGHNTGDSATDLDELLGSFGAIDNSEHVYSTDGKTVVFGGQEPGFYEGLKWLNTLYTEGLIDNEVFTMDNAQFTAKAKNPDLIVGSLLYWIPDAMDPRFKDYIPMTPLAGPDGTQMWNRNRKPLGTMQGFAVTTACQEPEVLVRYYDTLMSSFEMAMNWQWGPEFGGAWKRVDGDKWMQTMEYVPEGMPQVQFKRTIAGSVQSPMYLWSKYTNMEVPDDRNALKREGNEKCLPFSVTPMPNGQDETEEAYERDLLFVDIDSYMKKFKATAIVDGINDEQWQEHLGKLNDLKVNEYVELWQKYFDRFQD